MRRMLGIFASAVLLGSGLAVLPASPVVADTIAVTSSGDSGPGTLRQAVLDAQDGDEIVIAAGVNPSLTSGQIEIAKSLTIQGQGANQTTISANEESRIFAIAEETEVTIEDVTLTRGRIRNGGGAIVNSGTLTFNSSVLSGNTTEDGDDEVVGAGNGGAISNTSTGTLTINSSVLSGNTTGDGINGGRGGAIVNSGTLTINSSVLSGNETGDANLIFESLGGAGGAIYNGGGNLTITSSTLSANTTGGGSPCCNGYGGHGGAIFNDEGTVTITSSTLSDNTTGGHSNGGTGGAIFNSGGIVGITSSTLSGNTTGEGGNGGGDGGGLYNSGSLTISSSTLSANTTGDGTSIAGAGGDGGAILNDSGSLTITSSTLSANTTGHTNILFEPLPGSAGAGGAISNSGTVAITSSTLAGNTTGDGGCGFFEGGNGGAIHTFGTLTITSSTLKNNTADCTGGGIWTRGDSSTSLKATILHNSASSGAHDCFGPHDSQGYNVINDTSNCAISLDPVDDVEGNPFLGVLDDNGGPTQTIALLSGSPAIDLHPVTDPDCSGAGTDQRGFTRPAGPHCDAGALEVGGMPTNALVVRTEGEGIVTGDGISCPSDCTGNYEEGTGVTLTADASTGWTFAGWSGEEECEGLGTCVLDMNEDKDVTATFVPGFTLEVTLAGEGSGIVTADGINCPDECTAHYDSGTPVTLSAAPDSGSLFAGWSGDDCTGTGNCTLAMNEDKEVTATFVPAPTMEVTLDSSGTIDPRESSITISGTYTCTDADDVVISGVVEQQRAKTSKVISGSFEVVPDGPCDGAPHGWEASGITSETDPGVFFVRDTSATVKGEACNSGVPNDSEACAENSAQGPITLARE